MRPIHWWAGVSVLAVVVILHALFPRYEWRSVAQVPDALIRVDRWTGAAQVGAFRADWGRWVSVAEAQRDRAGKRAVLDREIDSTIAATEAATRSPRVATSKPARPADCSPEAQQHDVWVAVDCALTERPATK